jgi:hypothetical protein
MPGGHRVQAEKWDCAKPGCPAEIVGWRWDPLVKAAVGTNALRLREVDEIALNYNHAQAVRLGLQEYGVVQDRVAVIAL